LATKNCVTTDLEISSQIVSLPIQKSAAKNCVAADSEISSNGGVISALLLFFFFGVYIKNPNNLGARLGC
jgi:hypothetical protein